MYHYVATENEAAAGYYDDAEERTPFVRDLTEAEVAEGYLLAPRCSEFNPQRYDFRWNEDYSGFVPVKLLWWDDASYIAYQSDPGCDGDEDARAWEQNATPEEREEAAQYMRELEARDAARAAARPDFGDELPF